MQNAEFTERKSPFSTNQYICKMEQLCNSEINIKSEWNEKKNIQASGICTKVFVFKIKKNPHANCSVESWHFWGQ